tara:strand:- start:930 stop:1112 length:183 start_codon:yes stop_codon:yes gene_type:complete
MNITVTKFNENEDGSADCTFEADKEGKEALLRFGLVALLKEAMAQGQALAVPETENKDGQ